MHLEILQTKKHASYTIHLPLLRPSSAPLPPFPLPPPPSHLMSMSELAGCSSLVVPSNISAFSRMKSRCIFAIFAMMRARLFAASTAFFSRSAASLSRVRPQSTVTRLEAPAAADDSPLAPVRRCWTSLNSCDAHRYTAGNWKYYIVILSNTYQRNEWIRW